MSALQSFCVVFPSALFSSKRGRLWSWNLSGRCDFKWGQLWTLDYWIIVATGWLGFYFYPLIVIFSSWPPALRSSHQSILVLHSAGCCRGNGILTAVPACCTTELPVWALALSNPKTTSNVERRSDSWRETAAQHQLFRVFPAENACTESPSVFDS